MKDRPDATEPGSEGVDSQPLKELISTMRQVFGRGREEVARGAKLGRLKLDLYQLKRGKAALFERMGREVFLLLEEDLIPFPVELQKPFRKVREIDAQIQALELSIAQFNASESEETSKEWPSEAAPQDPGIGNVDS